MDRKRVLLAGATGLVGGECLKALQNADFCEQISLFVRTPIKNLSEYPKAAQHVVDFDNPQTYGRLAACDIAICALGSTMKKAGSKPAFYKVDFTYSLDVARAALEHGAQHFILVSAMGALPESLLYYNRVKGELEQAVMGLGYPCVSIFRPSIILGNRKESRLAEEIGKFFVRLFGFAIPGKYKPVHARAIAGAIVDQAASSKAGTRIFESREIREWAHP